MPMTLSDDEVRLVRRIMDEDEDAASWTRTRTLLTGEFQTYFKGWLDSDREALLVKMEALGLVEAE